MGFDDKARVGFVEIEMIQLTIQASKCFNCPITFAKERF